MEKLIFIFGRKVLFHHYVLNKSAQRKEWDVNSYEVSDTSFLIQIFWDL